MNISKENLGSPPIALRSPFSVNVPEIVLAIVVAMVTWQKIRDPLFSKYAVPFLVLNTLGAIFLVRAIRQDVRGFSRLGSVVLAWPLLSLLGIPVFFFFGTCVLPLGFLLGIYATAISIEEKRNRLDWISLPISFLNMVVCGMYLLDYLNLVYGD